MPKDKFFLMSGYGLKSAKGTWNKLDSSTNLKNVIKKMNTYTKEWEGARNFAIVKSESAVHGKRQLRDAIMIKRGRARAKRKPLYDGDNPFSWRMMEMRDKKTGQKSNKGFWGEIIKLQLRDW